MNLCENPLVSVPMAAYNNASFLAEAVSSVLNQTYENLELIVVDDGSTDNTEEIIKPFLKDERLRYIRIEHEGCWPAKNRALRESKGRFIAFIDSDDIWKKKKLEKQLPLFSNKKTGIVYSGWGHIDAEGKDILVRSKDRCYRGDVLTRIIVANFVYFSSAIIRRECLIKIGFFNENYNNAMDYEFWIRMAFHFHFDYIDEILVKYRVHSGQISANMKRRYGTVESMLMEYLKGSKENQSLSFAQRALLRSHIYAVRAKDEIVSKPNVNASYNYLIAAAYDPLNGYLWRRSMACLLPEKTIYLTKKIFMMGRKKKEY